MKQYISLILMFVSMMPAALFAGRETARVISVVDGDTLKILYHGKRESIRLIGIDAPESRKNSKASRDARKSMKDINLITAQGKLAGTYVRGLVRKGDTVSIQFDVEKRDRYRRLLGYVYLPDGRMLNDLIIRNGYAQTLTIPPNVKYRGKFLASYRYARKHGLGLWK
jgi:micrococcal nuclease